MQIDRRAVVAQMRDWERADQPDSSKPGMRSSDANTDVFITLVRPESQSLGRLLPSMKCGTLFNGPLSYPALALAKHVRHDA